MLRNLLSRYLTVLILLPTLIVLLITIWQLTLHGTKMNQASIAVELLTLTNNASELVHETQKERGLSAAYLGSGGREFKQALLSQREVTDQKIADYKAFLNAERMATFSTRVTESVDEIYQSLNQLDKVRPDVNTLNVSAAEMLGFYSELNRLLIEQPLIVIRYVDDKYLTEDLIALYNLKEVKEKSGIERAVLTNILASKTFTMTNTEKIYSVIAQQIAYEDGFTKSASERRMISYQDYKQSEANVKALELRQQALIKAKQGQFTLSPSEWFSASTERINALKSLEETILIGMKDEISAIYTHEFTTALISLAGLALVLIIATGVFINIRTMRTQAMSLRDTLNHVIEKHDLTVSVPVISQDQLGQSAELVNEMIAVLKEDFASIVEQTNRSISSTEQTMVAILQSEENIRKQLDYTTSTASAVEEIAASIKDVSQSIDDTANCASSAKLECADSQKAVGEAINHIGLVADEINSLSDNIHDLDERVVNISSVLDVIQSVAEQTNLLALNAAIEAARAGEQGRGFAVVADEVRQLAQRVQSSTEEISQIINQLQNDSKTATTVIQQVKQRSEDAVGVSTTIGHSLDQIVGSINEVNDMAVGISERGRQQSEVTQDITQSVTAIDQMSQENMTGANEITAAAKQMTTVTTDLLQLVERYKVGLSQLK